MSDTGASEKGLTRAAIRDGVWRGEIALGDAELPAVEVRHLDRLLDRVEVSRTGEATAEISVPIPAELLSDGVQNFVVLAAENGARLGSFTIVTGHPAGDDLRAEIALLREELDMLKRAFRRHCVETAGA